MDAPLRGTVIFPWHYLMWVLVLIKKRVIRGDVKRCSLFNVTKYRGKDIEKHHVSHAPDTLHAH